MSCSCYFTNVRLHRFSIPFRFRLRNSNSDFNSTQSYLLIEHQELLILPFCITSCERVYVSEDAEDDTTSPLLLFTVDENKSPNHPSCLPAPAVLRTTQTLWSCRQQVPRWQHLQFSKNLYVLKWNRCSPLGFVNFIRKREIESFKRRWAQGLVRRRW